MMKDLYMAIGDNSRNETETGCVILLLHPFKNGMITLAVTDLFKAKWTADIHEEWIEALLRKEPHRDRAALERTRDVRP